MGQRDSILQLAPPWLLDDVGRAFLGTIGTGLDMLAQKADTAIKLRMPGLSDPCAIPYQAADRLLLQGPGETNAAFILRLQGAYDAWKRAGSRRSVLAQIHAYLSNVMTGVDTSRPECEIVGGNASLSTWDVHTIGDAAEAPPAHTVISPANWNVDGRAAALPARAWLVLFMHQVATGLSGAAGTIASIGGSGVSGVSSGFATLTGLSGLDASNVQEWITISGATNSSNNGTFPIDAIVDPTSCIIANPLAIASPEPGNGALVWSIGRYPFLRPGPVWGSNSFVWGTSTWGLSASDTYGGDIGAQNIVQTLRLILKRWKGANTFYPHIIISFGGGDATAGNEFSPLSSQGSGNPDGTWLELGAIVAGRCEPRRNYPTSFVAFCDGSGLAVQCYEKNRS